MKQNKVLALAMAAMGVTGVSGVADASNIGLTLTGVTSYSDNGIAPAILTGTVLAGWVYNDVAGTVKAPGTYADQYFVAATPIFNHNIQNLVISSTGAPSTAMSYTCVEGSFGSVFGASLCGNYSFGVDAANNSSSTWGPGLFTSRTPGGDDVVIGPQQNLSFYSGFSVIAFGGGTATFGNTTDGDPAHGGTWANSNGNLANAKSGYVFTFSITGPDAANDGTIYASPTVAKVVPVGANDVNFNDPVTISIITPPTQGGLSAISAPGAAAGMTLTYTANPATSGADSFIYEMTDGVSTDQAAVTINISPDTDGDGQADNNDNCQVTANNATGTVANSAISIPMPSGVAAFSPLAAVAQLDADQDGYGNFCDGDLNNSSLTTATDNAVLRGVLNNFFNVSVNAAKSDMNGSGTVTATDNTLLRNRLNTVPGPSGYGCGQPAGSSPCP